MSHRGSYPYYATSCHQITSPVPSPNTSRKMDGGQISMLEHMQGREFMIRTVVDWDDLDNLMRN